ncbi:MAG: prepilin-type N-terminal cleavage/methylation domain-containing protein [Planctomycetota bacterium]
MKVHLTHPRCQRQTSARTRPRTVSVAGNAYRRGLSLIELMVVVGVLAVLAGLVIPLLGQSADNARALTTQATLRQVRDAVMGTPDAAGYWQHMAAMPADEPLRLPQRLQDLWVAPTLPTAPVDYSSLETYDPTRRLGWNGPYLLAASGRYQVDGARAFSAEYGDNGDAAPLDGWGSPIVIQVQQLGSTMDARLVSAGPDGVIDTPADVPDPLAARIDDDLVLFLRQATHATRNFINASGNQIE